MNLDEKLKAIIRDVPDEDGYCDGVDLEEAIRQIHHTFDEAGYIKHDEYGVVQVYAHNATNVMTGAEWYDRFIQELNSGLALPHPAMTKWVEVCARRAAGLTEDSK